MSCGEEKPVGSFFYFEDPGEEMIWLLGFIILVRVDLVKQPP